MSKKLLAACLMATALTTAPALAQTSPTSTQFMNEQPRDQWRGSKLMGLDVYGSDNQKIGDIRDILVDRNGEAKAVVIGVGGFLGIGEKDVAVPFKSLQFKDEPVRATGTASTVPARTDANTTASTATAPGATATRDAGSNTAGTGTGSTAGTAPGGVTNPTPMGSGTTASTSAGTTASRDTAATRGYPDHAVLAMTKDDLNKAPEFKYAGSTSTTRPAGTGTGPATGAGTAPAPAPRQ